MRTTAVDVGGIKIRTKPLLPRAELNTRKAHVPHSRPVIDFTVRSVEHLRKLGSDLYLENCRYLGNKQRLAFTDLLLMYITERNRYSK